MEYKVKIVGMLKGLNDLLDGKVFVHTSSTGRVGHYVNSIKARNDKACMTAIRACIPDVKITKPIVIDYQIYAGNRRYDRMNLASAIDKSFEDALQRCGVIRNDGWKNVLNATFGFHVVGTGNIHIDITIKEVEDEENDIVQEVPSLDGYVYHKELNERYGHKYNSNWTLVHSDQASRLTVNRRVYINAERFEANLARMKAERKQQRREKRKC